MTKAKGKIANTLHLNYSTSIAIFLLEKKRKEKETVNDFARRNCLKDLKIMAGMTWNPSGIKRKGLELREKDLNTRVRLNKRINCRSEAPWSLLHNGEKHFPKWPLMASVLNNHSTFLAK